MICLNWLSTYSNVSGFSAIGNLRASPPVFSQSSLSTIGPATSARLEDVLTESAILEDGQCLEGMHFTPVSQRAQASLCTDEEASRAPRDSRRMVRIERYTRPAGTRAVPRTSLGSPAGRFTPGCGNQPPQAIF